MSQFDMELLLLAAASQKAKPCSRGAVSLKHLEQVRPRSGWRWYQCSRIALARCFIKMSYCKMHWQYCTRNTEVEEAEAISSHSLQIPLFFSVFAVGSLLPVSDFNLSSRSNLSSNLEKHRGHLVLAQTPEAVVLYVAADQLCFFFGVFFSQFLHWTSPRDPHGNLTSLSLSGARRYFIWRIIAVQIMEAAS